jgi:FG-GAP-like repeat
VRTRSFIRGRAAATAALAVLALTGGPLGGAVAHADGGGRPEVVVSPGDRWLPRQETLETAGTSGYLVMTTPGSASWTDGNGKSAPASMAGQYNGSLWARHTQTTPTRVQIGDYATGAVTSTLTVPDGQTYASAFTAGAILTADASGGALHVVRDAGDGGTTDQTVTGLPAGAALDQVLDMSGDQVAVRLRVDGAPHVYLLNLATASGQEVFAGISQIGTVSVGGTRVVATTAYGTTAYTVRVDDPAATVEQTPYPASVLAQTHSLLPTPDGDRILLYDTDGDPHMAGGALWSVPVGGGDAQLLLQHAENTRVVAPDGSVLVIGGSGLADWAVRRVATDGSVTALTPLVPVPAAVHSLAFSAGRLVYSTNTGAYDPLVYRDVTAGAAPAVTGPSTLWSMGPKPGTHLQGLGNGTVAFLASPSEVISPIPGEPKASYTLLFDAAATAVLDGAGGDVIVDTPGLGTQTVANLRNSFDTFTRSRSASAVWDHLVWVAGTTPGTLRPYNLRNLAYGATVQTDAPCTNYSELQANGRWLYWSCGTTAGVYDRTTGRDIAVPAGRALLGDGFVVQHSGDRLVMTDVHADTAVTSDLAALPAATQADDRGIMWTVDKYAGGLAYTDAGNSIHVVPSLGVPPSAKGPVAHDYDGDGVGDLLGLTTAGTLNIRPGDGSGGVGSSTGDYGQWPTDWTYIPTGDLDGDGCNDLLARSTSGSGTLFRHLGGCDGPPNGPTLTIGAGWNIYDSLVSPGDLNGDGRPDLLARTPSGDLYFYAGNAAGVFAPPVKIGFGYDIYPMVAGVQDLTGDGVGDVLARDASGALWRYDGDGKGGLTPRERIGAGWNVYNAIVGVGDINGDGRNDLVARDGNGDLWRYDGLSNGLFAPRVKIGWAWQTYKALL